MTRPQNICKEKGVRTLERSQVFARMVGIHMGHLLCLRFLDGNSRRYSENGNKNVLYFLLCIQLSAKVRSAPTKILKNIVLRLASILKCCQNAKTDVIPFEKS